MRNAHLIKFSLLPKVIYRLPYFAIAALLAVTFLSSCSGENKKAATEAPATTDSVNTATVYICPMNCENGKTYNKPGQCPVCGMDLAVKS